MTLSLAQTSECFKTGLDIQDPRCSHIILNGEIKIVSSLQYVLLESYLGLIDWEIFLNSLKVVQRRRVLPEQPCFPNILKCLHGRSKLRVSSNLIFKIYQALCEFLYILFRS